MSKVTKNFLTLFSVVCSVLFFSSQVWAIALSFSPPTSEIGIGGHISIDLVISGMENDDLGYFEFDVNYDDSILGFNSYTLDSGLGDIAAFDADDWSAGDLGGGTINLIELSYLMDLSFQADSFTLATLSFTSLGEGTSVLSYSNVVLGDDWGGALFADLASGSVDVTGTAPVPEPASIFLFSSGLLSFVALRKKIKK